MERLGELVGSCVYIKFGDTVGDSIGDPHFHHIAGNERQRGDDRIISTTADYRL